MAEPAGTAAIADPAILDSIYGAAWRRIPPAERDEIGALAVALVATTLRCERAGLSHVEQVAAERAADAYSDLLFDRVQQETPTIFKSE